MDRPAKEDGQRLREAVCERGGVRICCHDSPHDEAARPCLRTFHTVSEGEFCELRLLGILGSSCVRPRTRIVYYCEHPSCWTDGRNRGSLCLQNSRAGDTRLNASPSLASHIVPECSTCARLWSAPGQSSRSSSSTVVLRTNSESSTSSVKARCCSASLTPMRRSQFMLIHTERPSPLSSSASLRTSSTRLPGSPPSIT